MKKIPKLHIKGRHVFKLWVTKHHFASYFWRVGDIKLEYFLFILMSRENFGYDQTSFQKERIVKNESINTVALLVME